MVPDVADSNRRDPLRRPLCIAARLDEPRIEALAQVVYHGTYSRPDNMAFQGVGGDVPAIIEEHAGTTSGYAVENGNDKW